MSNFFQNPFKLFFPKKIIGIDVGTSSVRIVELSRWGGGKTLENYGEAKSDAFYRESLTSYQKGSYLLSSNSVAKTIKLILQEAKIKTKAVVFSVPDFSTFCTSFDIPPMTEKEIPAAIQFNASQYITLPVSEVTLDWKIVSNSPGDKNSSLKVFLVAVPNQIIAQYQTLAKTIGLELYALEVEALGVTRSLVKNNKKTTCLIDVGMQSSTINIIDKGFLKKSYNFNFSSSALTDAIASTLGVPVAEAETIKTQEGLLYQRQDVVKALYLLVEPLLLEIKNVSTEFFQSEKKQIEEIYLTGGTASMPGLKEYFSESLKKNVYIPNCFSEFLYPPILEETLKDISPSFSAAVGVALGGLET